LLNNNKSNKNIIKIIYNLMIFINNIFIYLHIFFIYWDYQESRALGPPVSPLNVSDSHFSLDKILWYTVSESMRTSFLAWLI